MCEVLLPESLTHRSNLLLHACHYFGITLAMPMSFLNTGYEHRGCNIHCHNPAMLAFGLECLVKKKNSKYFYLVCSSTQFYNHFQQILWAQVTLSSRASSVRESHNTRPEHRQATTFFHMKARSSSQMLKALKNLNACLVYKCSWHLFPNLGEELMLYFL